MSYREVIKIELVNNAFMRIHCDQGIAMEITEHFKFRVPNYQFMPSYRNKMWDGYIRLFDRRKQTLYAGLYHYVVEFAKEYDYDIELIKTQYGICGEQDIVDIDELLGMLTLPKKIDPYDYQLDSVVDALTNRRKLLLSPTSSGKSLIIYMLIRYYLEFGDGDILLCVPRKGLVHQMYSDFEEYAEFDPWSVEDNCHKIYAGQEKYSFDQRVVISTWQSIHRLPKKWFARFGMVIGDEAHEFKAKSLTTMMESCTEAAYRIGTTGTLDDSLTNQLVLEGLFGKVKKVITTKKLMEQGKVAQLKIHMLVVKYKDELRKACAKLKYPEEIDLIVKNEQRNNFITKLSTSLKGNTLVLFQYVDKHGKPLYEQIKNHAGNDRKVFYVSGETHVNAREEVRKIVQQEDDAIIVASFGTFSTGINIPRIHNIVFTSPSKSIIKILQSIGRVLRLSKDGLDATCYDITDDLCWKSRKNYAFKHGAIRMDIYKKESFTTEIHNIQF